MMADGRRCSLNQQLDMEQILLEAQNRWLRPAEICEILRNYRKFHIAPEPPNKPPSGSIFLFDRKVLRYFRKDGHNWRKKKDGKTVREAHERLKAESIDVLHCYYAHGEENESFQRRTYWMLEEAFMHIVLVHYLEVKGGKTSYSRGRNDGIARVAHMDSPVCSNSFTSQDQLPSQTTDAGSANSAQTSEYEDAQSDNSQARSRYHPFLGLQEYENGLLMDAHILNSNLPVSSLINQYDHQILQPITQESNFYDVSKENIAKVFNGIGLDLGFSGSRAQIDLPPWDEVLESPATGFTSASIQTLPETGSAEAGNIHKQATLTFEDLLTDEVNIKQQDAYTTKLQVYHPDVGSVDSREASVQCELSLEGNMNSPAMLKHSSLGFSNVDGEGLKKYDSFSKWMSKELAGVDDSHMKSSSQACWNFMDNERVDDSGMSNPEQDAFIVGPSVSQDQLFSIVDFSPNWAYSGLETKVLITGKFLEDKKDVQNIKLSCMFGEVEVPAEILANGMLRCHAPTQRPGRVPFYITCSNRLACSEVREFEYRVNHTEYIATSDLCTSNTNELHLHVCLGKLLSLGTIDYLNVSNDTAEKLHIRNKISSLLMEADDKWFNMLNLTNNKEFSPDRVKDLLLQRLLKDKLHDWLLHKIAEDGKGPNVLDEEGQGVIHLTAALGYDWAIKPIITAGVNINFRDARGWTALHWAAFCGRERTVVSLVTLRAFTGALTDPTPDFPSGRTPADLASGNGHKGIAGFLAESSLTSHLSALTVMDTRGIDMTDVSGLEGIGNLDEQSAIHFADGDVEAGLSLKHSLCAVRNAALAAARIHQVFRVDSFQRKNLVEYGDDQCGISEEQALSLVSVKTSKTGQTDMPVHAAAIRIQNKYRGWKGRKEFLVTRQRIVKIQAHVRGHQVRKRYKKIVWTVGIVEKIILRWRRKGSGLRGFRSEGLIEGTSMQIEPAKEDDYDFLRDGRKQTEARMEKALARVKSMVQYPEARDQYRRLLTKVTELQDSNLMEEKLMNDSEAAEGDFMVELEELCEDDSFVSSA